MTVHVFLSSQCSPSPPLLPPPPPPPPPQTSKTSHVRCSQQVRNWHWKTGGGEDGIVRRIQNNRNSECNPHLYFFRRSLAWWYHLGRWKPWNKEDRNEVRLEKFISPSLAVIINKSLNQGYLPKSLKLARVVALHKGGSRDDINYYRPVSILAILSKIIERTVHSRLYSFMDKLAKHPPSAGFLTPSGRTVPSAPRLGRLRRRV